MKKGLLHINKKNNKFLSKGFSLVEILLSISVFLIFVLATTGVVSSIFQNAQHAANNEQANILAEEAIEVIRNLRDSGTGFSSLPDGIFGLSVSGSQWNLSGSSDTQGIFTRVITISTINNSQKKVSVDVSWVDKISPNGLISLNTYLTDWRALLNIGLTVNKTVINHGGVKTAGDFLPSVLTTLVWDNSIDPPVQNTADIPIVFSPTTMALSPGTYTFLTSNDPDYSVILSNDCVSNSITFVDGDTKLCNITYEEYTVPSLNNPTDSSIAQNTAILGANITSPGNPPVILSRGTCFGLNPAPTENCLDEGSTATGLFTQTRTGLMASTTYYYRGYATNSRGVGYSPDGIFTTLPSVSLPVVTSVSPIINITKTDATGGGNVTSDGGDSVTARGVVWDTSTNPTIALSTKTSDGTGTGAFASNLTGLLCNTTYYVRAYATNSAGTAYGSEVVFKTASCVTFVNSASVGANSITIPTHQIGDLLIMFAYRDGNNAAPALPVGWINIGTADGANNNSSRLAYRIATATNDASGTWTNATGLVVIVYRGQNLTNPIGNNAGTGGQGVTITYPGFTLNQTDGSSWVVGFAGHRSVNTSLQTPPSGMINRTNFVNTVNEVSGHDTNSGVSVWVNTNVNVAGTVSGWRARTLEIISK